jgi:hypothetical protein
MNARGLGALPGAARGRGADPRLRRGRPAALYEGEVFYCKDAFEGLRVLDAVLEAPGGTVPEELPAQAAPQADEATARRSRNPPAATRRAGPARGRHRRRRADPAVLGPAGRARHPVDEVAPLLNEVALFRNQWGFTPATSPDGYRGAAGAKARPVLREWLARARRRRSSPPRSSTATTRRTATATTWWCGTRTRRSRRNWSAVHFPRQDRGRFLCIADFFRPVDSGEARRARRPGGDDGPADQRGRPGAVRRRPLPGLPVRPRVRRRDGRGAGRAVAPPDPRGARDRRRRRPDRAGLVPPGLPRVALLVRLRRLPGPRGPGEAVPADRPGAIDVELTDEFMLHPSSRPPRSSSTTRRRSTSTPGRPSAGCRPPRTG